MAKKFKVMASNAKEPDGKCIPKSMRKSVESACGKKKAVKASDSECKYRIDIFKKDNPDALVKREFKMFKSEDEAKKYGESIANGNIVNVMNVNADCTKKSVKSGKVLFPWAMVGRFADGYTCEVSGDSEADCIEKLGNMQDKHGELEYYSGVDDDDYDADGRRIYSSRTKRFGVKASKAAKKRVAAAKGYWADDINAESYRKILKALDDYLIANYDGKTIGDVEIGVSELRNIKDGKGSKIEVEFYSPDYEKDTKLEVISAPDLRSKFLCRVSVDPFKFDEELEIPQSGSKQIVVDKINEIANRLSGSAVESSCKTKKTVKASAAAKKRKAIKASGITDDIVIYFNGDNVYQGSIYDMADAIENLCYDDGVNAKFQEWCNQFGDPFDFDGSPIDTARVFTDIIIHEAEESPVSEDGQSEFYEDGDGILDFEIFYANDGIYSAKSIKCTQGDFTDDFSEDEFPFRVTSYYDHSQRGIADGASFDDMDEAVAYAHEKLSEGPVRIEHYDVGAVDINPDEYWENFDGEFWCTPELAEWRDEVWKSMGIGASKNVNAGITVGEDDRYDFSNPIYELDDYVKALADGTVNQVQGITYDISKETIAFFDADNNVVFVQPIGGIIPEPDDLETDIYELSSAIKSEMDSAYGRENWEQDEDDPDYASRAVELSTDVKATEETVDIDDLEYVTGDTSAEDRIFDVIVDKLRTSELAEFGEVDVLGGDADIKIYPDGADIDYIIAFIADPIAIGLEDRFMKYVKHPNYNDLNSTQQINGLTIEIIVHNGVISAVNYVDLDDYDLSNYDVTAYEDYVEKLARPIVEEIYNFIDQTVYDGNIISSTKITADADDDLPDMGYGFDSNGDPIDESTVEELYRIAEYEILPKSELAKIDEYVSIDEDSWDFYMSSPHVTEKFYIHFKLTEKDIDFNDYTLPDGKMFPDFNYYTAVLDFDIYAENGEITSVILEDKKIYRPDGAFDDYDVKQFDDLYNVEALINYVEHLAADTVKDIYNGTTNL